MSVAEQLFEKGRNEIDPKIEKQIQSISNLEKLEDLIVDFSDFSKKEEFLKKLNV